MDFHTYALRMACAMVRHNDDLAAEVFNSACKDRHLELGELSKLAYLLELLRG